MAHVFQHPGPRREPDPSGCDHGQRSGVRSATPPDACVRAPRRVDVTPLRVTRPRSRQSEPMLDRSAARKHTSITGAAQRLALSATPRARASRPRSGAPAREARKHTSITGAVQRLALCATPHARASRSRSGAPAREARNHNSITRAAAAPRALRRAPAPVARARDLLRAKRATRWGDLPADTSPSYRCATRGRKLVLARWSPGGMPGSRFSDFALTVFPI